MGSSSVAFSDIPAGFKSVPQGGSFSDIPEGFQSVPDFAANPPKAAGPHVNMQPMAGTESLNIPRPMSLGPGQPEKDPNLATAGAVGLAAGAAGPTGVAARVAPYALPALGSYAINKAREWPVVGPVINKIPMAEMLPWLFEGKGKSKVPPEEPVYPGAHLPDDPGVFPGAPLPARPPREALQGAALERGPTSPTDPSAGLSRITLSQQVRQSAPPRLIRQMGGKPVESITDSAAYSTGPGPVIQRGPIPGSPEDIAETKSLQEQVRESADAEGRTFASQQKREWFARNQPGTSKGDLTNAPEKPVKYTKTPGVKGGDSSKALPEPPPGTTVPKPDQNLTPLLRKSLKDAMKKKGD